MQKVTAICIKKQAQTLPEFKVRCTNTGPCWATKHTSSRNSWPRADPEVGHQEPTGGLAASAYVRGEGQGVKPSSLLTNGLIHSYQWDEKIPTPPISQSDRQALCPRQQELLAPRDLKGYLSYTPWWNTVIEPCLQIEHPACWYISPGLRTHPRQLPPWTEKRQPRDKEIAGVPTSTRG